MSKQIAKRVMRGVEVSAIGFGCMSLSGVYGASDDAAGIALIREALDRGVTISIPPTCTAGATTRSWSAEPSRAGAPRWCWRPSSAISAAAAGISPTGGPNM